MTKVAFFEKAGQLVGFSLNGHSTTDCDDETGKLVCAAVSSAAYLTANTVTEVCRQTAQVRLEDSFMELHLVGSHGENAVAMLEGFRLHITALAQQYPANIKITTEV